VDFSTSNERDALTGFLDRQRDALVRKVRGVSDADARRAPTASSLSLLGLLKHAAVWEDRWFQGIVAGRSLPDGWPERKSPIPDEDFLVDDGDTVETARHAGHADLIRETLDGSRGDPDGRPQGSTPTSSSRAGNQPFAVEGG
jgi:Protein of unknown function (DUF664)